MKVKVALSGKGLDTSLTLGLKMCVFDFNQSTVISLCKIAS